MVKINIVAVGKLKENFLRDGCAEYLKRLKAFANVNVTEIAEAKSLEIEGEKILEKAKGFLVVLDVGAKQLTSEQFAEFISSTTTNGVSEISFVIGSSHGLSQAVKSAADMRLGFSEMTFPHQLMRLIFLEQLYRGFMILNNSAYHK